MSSVFAFSCLTPVAAQQVIYYHIDSVGSVRAVTDSSANVIERHDYYAFGEECTTAPCAAPGAGQPLHFSGKERDQETGFDYFGARYYGSKVARFTTVDPLMNTERNLGAPQGWNRYSYALNNPLRFVDPDGRDVSIAITFTATLSSADKTAIITKVAAWYDAQGVGNAYVFDNATKDHAAYFAGIRSGHADISVLPETGGAG